MPFGKITETEHWLCVFQCPKRTTWARKLVRQWMGNRLNQSALEFRNRIKSKAFHSWISQYFDEWIQIEQMTNGADQLQFKTGFTCKCSDMYHITSMHCTSLTSRRVRDREWWNPIAFFPEKWQKEGWNRWKENRFWIYMHLYGVSSASAVIIHLMQSNTSVSPSFPPPPRKIARENGTKWNKNESRSRKVKNIPEYFNDCSIYFELNMSRIREVESWKLCPLRWAIYI